MSQFMPNTEKSMLKHEIQPLHIKFDSNDSEGCDASYESSLSSSNEHLQDAENFKQEMSRFFINHPQLMNNDIIQNLKEPQSLWIDLSNGIINEAKEDMISLQSIAKRIFHYREKTQRNDVIDLIVQEKDLILKDLEEESKINAEDNIYRKEDKTVTVGANINTDQAFFSWRKRHEAHLMNNVHKNSTRKNVHSQELRVSAELLRSPPLRSKASLTRLTKARSVDKNGKGNDGKADRLMEEEVSKATLHQSRELFKNLNQLEIKTEPARQLMEEIKKSNASDEIGVKKVIISFLVKYRESVQKELMNKSNLAQRISKLHIQDSKELFIFCPIKQNIGDSNVPLNIETDHFMDILKEISEGHLMKYWKLLQEKKL